MRSIQKIKCPALALTLVLAAFTHVNAAFADSRDDNDRREQEIRQRQMDDARRASELQDRAASADKYWHDDRNFSHDIRDSL